MKTWLQLIKNPLQKFQTLFSLKLHKTHPQSRETVPLSELTLTTCVSLVFSHFENMPRPLPVFVVYHVLVMTVTVANAIVTATISFQVSLQQQLGYMYYGCCAGAALFWMKSQPHHAYLQLLQVWCGSFCCIIEEICIAKSQR